MATSIKKKGITTVLRVPNELVDEFKIRIAFYRLECEKQELDQLIKAQSSREAAVKSAA